QSTTVHAGRAQSPSTATRVAQSRETRPGSKASPTTSSPPAGIASESVATTTGPTAASCARRNTCTIIGAPAISASGLPGRRGAALRGGNKVRTSPIGGLYGVQTAQQNGELWARPPRPERAPPPAARYGLTPPPPAERPAMNSFELNKILGALLGTCLVLVAMHIAAGAIFTPEKPTKPGYEVAVKEEQPQAGAAPAAPAAVPIE